MSGILLDSFAGSVNDGACTTSLTNDSSGPFSALVKFFHAILRPLLLTCDLCNQLWVSNRPHGVTYSLPHRAIHYVWSTILTQDTPRQLLETGLVHPADQRSSPHSSAQIALSSCSVSASSSSAVQLNSLCLPGSVNRSVAVTSRVGSF